FYDIPELTTCRSLRKIESYREEQKNGKDLNSDQLAAVAKYDEVLQTLDFARDLCKQFTGIAVDAAKQQKKQARKEALEKAQQEIVKIKEILLIQDVLQNMGQENVREDFLAGRNGAALLGEEDLKFLDDFYVEVSPKHGEEATRPFQEQLQLSAEHLLSIVEGKPKEIAGTTYAKLKELITTIQSCGYFDQVRDEVVAEEQVVEVAAEAETEVVNIHEVIKEEYVPAVPATDTFPQQDITSASQPTSLPIANPVVAQPSAAVPSPVAAVESSYFTTATPTYVPAQAPPPLQQTRPLNEVINSVSGSFNFLQESELDSPELSAMLTGTGQQNQQPTPPPSGPVPVAPIPTQTFTNQNFASVSTSNVPQQVVYQAGTELAQPHIPGFATTTPNPPPPIPMPPSHLPHRSVSPPAIQQTYSGQPAKQPAYTAQTQQMYNTQQQQPPVTEPVDHQQVPEQISNVALVEDSTDNWGSSDNQGDWNQQTESQDDWSQQTETTNDWASAPVSQNDNYSSRVYGSGRGGRMGRGGGRGSSNGYSGNRPRGNYQNGRGGNSYGYRSNESGNNSYYQNGYQQRDNFGGNSGYKRGPRGSGNGGAGRGNGDRGGPRGSGNRGGNNTRGSRGSNYARGGNKQ
ncbi:hypothetical protein L9F63_010804, partial [Diploptera punctata]